MYILKWFYKINHHVYLYIDIWKTNLYCECEVIGYDFKCKTFIYFEVYTPHLTIIIKQPSSLSESESDVCRRQILTTKDDPRTVRVKV